jgi:hypothetical protein
MIMTTVESTLDTETTVTELPDARGAQPQSALFGSVLGVYEQHGYEAGYRRAVQDVLLTLLGTAEGVVRERMLDVSSAENLRRAVWAVHERLDARTDAATRDAAEGFVEGGLGI